MKRTVVTVVCAAIVLGSAAVASAQEKVSFYVTITSAKQGVFKGESLSAAHRGQIQGIRYFYQVSEPRDAATGQATGRRQVSAVTFTKEWGAASPQIYQAMATNETLTTVTFEFMHSAPNGTEQVLEKITLKDATISSIKRYVNYPTESGLADGRALEDIAITFRSMESENGGVKVIEGRSIAVQVQ